MPATLWSEAAKKQLDDTKKLKVYYEKEYSYAAERMEHLREINGN